MNIAIIPARGGSKRIPNKNIRNFNGCPIIAYSIDAALKSKLFDEVMVSTDSPAIAEIAQTYGASVPFRRSEDTASDYATTADVLLEVLTKYKELDKEFDNVCCIYPTAPFVTKEKLQKAFALFTVSGADALVPVVPFSYPPLRGLEVSDERLKMKWLEYLNTRSQDIEQLYHDCGQFYMIKRITLLTERTLFAKNTVPMFMPELEVQDIDNEADWKLAELKYGLMKGILPIGSMKNDG